MAASIGYCREHHPVVAYFGWDCPLCAALAGKALRHPDIDQRTVNDLRRAVVTDYNRVFYVHDDPDAAAG